MVDYLKISTRFIVGPLGGLDEYSGAVVAARDGFYLIFSARQISQAIIRQQGMMADLAGPFGSRLATKDEKSLHCTALLRGSLIELPEYITRHPEWPSVKDAANTWFIPTKAIDSISISIWYGVKVRVGDAQYNFAVGLFSHGRIRRGLRELGWLKEDR